MRRLRLFFLLSAAAPAVGGGCRDKGGEEAPPETDTSTDTGANTDTDAGTLLYPSKGGSIAINDAESTIAVAN